MPCICLNLILWQRLECLDTEIAFGGRRDEVDRFRGRVTWRRIEQKASVDPWKTAVKICPLLDPVLAGRTALPDQRIRILRGAKKLHGIGCDAQKVRAIQWIGVRDIFR